MFFSGGIDKPDIRVSHIIKGSTKAIHVLQINFWKVIWLSTTKDVLFIIQIPADLLKR